MAGIPADPGRHTRHFPSLDEGGAGAGQGSERAGGNRAGARAPAFVCGPGCVDALPPTTPARSTPSPPRDGKWLESRPIQGVIPAISHLSMRAPEAARRSRSGPAPQYTPRAWGLSRRGPAPMTVLPSTSSARPSNVQYAETEAAYWGISGAKRHYCTFECARKRHGVRSLGGREPWGGEPRGGGASGLGASGCGAAGWGARSTLRGLRSGGVRWGANAPGVDASRVGRRPGTGGNASASARWLGDGHCGKGRLARWSSGGGDVRGVSGPRGSTARPSETGGSRHTGARIRARHTHNRGGPNRSPCG